MESSAASAEESEPVTPPFSLRKLNTGGGPGPPVTFLLHPAPLCRWSRKRSILCFSQAAFLRPPQRQSLFIPDSAPCSVSIRTQLWAWTSGFPQPGSLSNPPLFGASHYFLSFFYSNWIFFGSLLSFAFVLISSFFVSKTIKLAGSSCFCISPFLV